MEEDRIILKIKCFFCEYIFTDPEECFLREHIAVYHLNYSPIRCSICNGKFSSQSLFLEHSKYRHKIEDISEAAIIEKDIIIDETLDSLVHLTNKNIQSSKVMPETNNNSCKLCSDLNNATKYSTRYAREEHIFSHIKSLNFIPPMIRFGRKSARKVYQREYRGFWKIYADCFPTTILDDIQVETVQLKYQPRGKSKSSIMAFERRKNPQESHISLRKRPRLAVGHYARLMNRQNESDSDKKIRSEPSEMDFEPEPNSYSNEIKIKEAEIPLKKRGPGRPRKKVNNLAMRSDHFPAGNMHRFVPLTSSTCRLCHNTVTGIRSLFTHVVNGHFDNHLWKCPICSFSSKLASSLVQEHIESMHQHEKSLKPIHLLPDLAADLRIIFNSCFPGRRMFVPREKETVNRKVKPLEMHICEQCETKVLSECLTDHVEEHLRGNEAVVQFQCGADDCTFGASTEQGIVEHCQSVHPDEPVSYEELTRRAIESMSKQCFPNSHLCQTCCQLISEPICVQHVWKHLFIKDKQSWRYQCLLCEPKTRFNLEVLMKGHMITVHDIFEDHVELYPEELIDDQTEEFRQKYTDEWAICFPNVDVDSSSFVDNATSFTEESEESRSKSELSTVFCKFCSVGVPSGQTEAHVYWHISRMFSLNRFRCRNCSCEDFERVRLVSRCTCPSLEIDDLTTESQSMLPRMFRACVPQCFDDPPNEIFSHLKGLQKDDQKVKHGVDLSDESSPCIKCKLCGDTVLYVDVDSHGEHHLMLSNQWNRFKCGHCHFSSFKSDRVNEHIRREHPSGVIKIDKLTRPNPWEVRQSRNRCFSAGNKDGSRRPSRIFEDCGSKTSLKCALCMSLIEDDPLTHTMRNHIGDFRYDCVFCSNGFDNKASLSSHISCEHREKPSLVVYAAVRKSQLQFRNFVSMIGKKCFGYRTASTFFEKLGTSVLLVKNN